MKDLLYLSFRHATHHWGRSLILVLCLAFVGYLPAVVQVLSARYEAGLTRRAEATPLVMGARGNRFDLTLAAIYFRAGELDPVPFREAEALQASVEGLAIPMNLRFTARGWPVVATALEYFDVRALRLASGTRPLRLGDVVLGAETARALGVGVGGTVHSDQRAGFDITESPSIAMRVTGVLDPTRGPDDRAVFTEMRTAWLLEGALHAHDDAETADPRAVYARTPDGVVLNSAVRELSRLTPENADRFHLHGEEGDLPLSAVLLFPASDKEATITKARVNAGSLCRILSPVEVVEDLLAMVFRLKAFLDMLALLLGVCVGGMTALVVLLTTRLRAREMRTLHAIGCARHTVLGLYAAELGLLVGAAATMAAAGVWATLALLPDLVTVL